MSKILLLCLTVLLAACNLIPGTSDSAAATPPQTINESTPTAPASALTQTHTDSVLGISFNYPADWIVDSTNPPGDLIQLYSPLALTPQPIQSEGLTGGGTKIEFIKLTPANPYSTIDEYIEFNQQGGGASSGTLEIRNRLTLGGSIPAARLQFNGTMAGDVPVMVFELDTTLVSAAGYGDVSRFDEILSTLRRS